MQSFVKLFLEIDQTTKTSEKVKYLSDYFSSAISDEDKLWTVAIFSHRRPPRAINSTQLRKWTSLKAQIPLWLFEDTYHIVGDLAETMSLLTPPPTRVDQISLSDYIKEAIALKKLDDEDKKQRLFYLWEGMNVDTRFLFNKILTGGFRIGVSQNLITKALALSTQQDESIVAHRIMGDWSPAKKTWKELLLDENITSDLSKPYPFYLAYALEGEVGDLGDCIDWAAEYKWDGIRGQIIIRSGKVYVWSRGEELVTDKFPEFETLGLLPYDVVIDGEIVVRKDQKLGTFNDLQVRIGRKSVSQKLRNETPVSLIAYDLLEFQGKDIRSFTYLERRSKLEIVLQDIDLPELISLSQSYTDDTWEKVTWRRDQASMLRAEGIMLKRLNSIYQDGRKRGDWWKWKIDPFTVDAVMIYAQRGHGRRANLFTDFTFAIWQDDVLVPFAKAYSGLTDEEFRSISEFVKNNTIERFGPVNKVEPALVFELAFEGIAKSSRHKSGIAVRFPRIKAWRKDKKPQEADKLENLLFLLS
jgi:DNA ligase 1